MKILLVDDNVDICEIMGEWLGDEKHDVTIAHSGNEAIELIKSKDFEALITDIKMPNGTGVELLEEILNLKIIFKVKYVMTGFSDINESEFINLGADQFFKKPVDMPFLLESLENYV